MDGILRQRTELIQNEVRRDRGDRTVAADTHGDGDDEEDNEALAVAGSLERRLPCVNLFALVVDMPYVAAADVGNDVVAGNDLASSFARVGGRRQILPLIPSFFVLVAFDQTCNFPRKRSNCVCFD